MSFLRPEERGWWVVSGRAKDELRVIPCFGHCVLRDARVLVGQQQDRADATKGNLSMRRDEGIVAATDGCAKAAGFFDEGVVGCHVILQSRPFGQSGRAW